MNFKELLEYILFEGWEELGIEDPAADPRGLEFTDEEIINKAPAPYGLRGSYDDNMKMRQPKAYFRMRKHPLYVQLVRNQIKLYQRQIEYLKRGERMPISIPDLPQKFSDLSDNAVKIAKDVGWGDARDIMISVQQHPITSGLGKTRDMLSAKLKKRGR